jgi:hypothetical protein
MKRHIWLMPVILVLALAGCVQPPKADMAAAEAAVARAEASADVAAYAPAELQRAKTALTQMRNEAAARHYDKAKAQAAEAIKNADTAIASAQANKARSKTKAEELIAAVKQALPQAEKLLADTARVKKAKIDREAKASELKGAKSGLAEAEAAYASGDFLTAIDKASAAQKTLADIESEIGGAVQSATRKK